MLRFHTGWGSEKFEKEEKEPPWRLSELAYVSQVMPLIRRLFIQVPLSLFPCGALIILP
jgi:hypothetical protein